MSHLTHYGRVGLANFVLSRWQKRPATTGICSAIWCLVVAATYCHTDGGDGFGDGDDGVCRSDDGAVVGAIRTVIAADATKTMMPTS